MIICELLATGRPEAVETAIDICLARFKLCKHLLLKHLSKIMEAYGLQSINELPEPYRIVPVITSKVKEKLSEQEETISEITSVLERKVSEQATRIVMAALYATLGSLGVECGLG